MADNTGHGSAVKSHLPDNTQFLQTVFGGVYPQAHVASFNDPPDQIDKDRRGICWGGFHYGDGKRVVPTQNNYFTISLFSKDAGRAVRRKSHFIATYCIVVDDVGTKVPASDTRLLTPSWKLETSPGNEQWGYILETPCSDQALASGTLAMMVAKGLCPDGKDPGMKGVTRYVRLPIGVNRKSKYPLGHVCKMTWWHPEVTFVLDELIESFGSTRAEVLAFAEGQGDGVGSAKDIGDDPMLTALNDLSMYLKKNPKTGWHDIICPWVDDHSEGDDSGTAVLVRTDGTYGFQCHHGHCEDKRATDLINWITKEHPETVEGTRFDPLAGFEVEQVADSAAETAKGVEEGERRKTLIEWPMEVVPTPVRWRVKGYLEANSIGVLWGEPGSFKSFIALDWALSVLYGNPWQGQFRVGDPADILIIAGEGRSGLARRVMAWRKHHGILLPPNGRMGMSKGAIHLNDEGFENVARIVDETRERGGSDPKLVLVDTVARNMGGNENAQEDMGRMVRAGDYLRQRLRGATVLFVHHANKGGDIRGSTVLVGAADFIYRVERKGHDSVVLKCDKMKDADEPGDVFLTRKVIKLGEVVDEDGEISDIDSCVMTAGPMVMQVEESMEDRINAAVYALHAEGKPPKSANAIHAKCGGDRNVVLKVIGEMLADGRLEQPKAKGVISVRGQHDHLL